VTTVQNHAAAAEFTLLRRLYEAGDFPQALRLLDGSGLLPALGAQSDDPALTGAPLVVANLYRDLGRFSAAEPFYLQALAGPEAGWLAGVAAQLVSGLKGCSPAVVPQHRWRGSAPTPGSGAPRSLDPRGSQVPPEDHQMIAKLPRVPQEQVPGRPLVALSGPGGAAALQHPKPQRQASNTGPLDPSSGGALLG
jgi:hypothetical protein